MESAEVMTVRSVLLRLIEARAEVRSRFNLAPTAGSIADRELKRQHEFAAEWSQEPVADCYVLAQVRLLAAVDHFAAVRELLESPDFIYAPASLARTALECTGRAWWLLDPEIDVESRVKRGAADRLVSMGELARTPIPEVKAHARERIDRILVGARRFDLEAVRTRTGVYRGLGDVIIPGIMETLREQLGETTGEVAYRELTLIAHGEPYGLIASSRVVADPTGRYEKGLFAPEVKAGTVASRMGAVVLSYMEAVDREVRLFGWDRTDWEASRDESKKAMGRLLKSLWP
jgi:hypothetical protein